MVRWKRTCKDGIAEIVLKSWSDFYDYVNREILDLDDYIFRGQASADWSLEPTLDRLLRQHGRERDPSARHQHLEAFKLAVRGRRGLNPPLLNTENDWWALGQHYGLATPLLDWSRSPFVAAFFAMDGVAPPRNRHRAVYALQHESVRGMVEDVEEEYGTGYAYAIDTLQIHSDENPRLVSQSGLFTRAPDGVTVEEWVQQQFAGAEGGVLIKIVIPERDRRVALKSLARMNIHSASLFPDLQGSSAYCNRRLEIRGY